MSTADERIEALSETVDRLITVVAEMQRSRDQFNELIYRALLQASDRADLLNQRCQFNFELIIKIARATQTRLDPSLEEAIKMNDPEAIINALADPHLEIGRAH